MYTSYIYMVYTWYIHEYTMYIPRIGYAWYIYGYTMHIHKVYTWYIQGYTWYILWCMYMVYTLYIHGYSWIFLAFWNQISRPASAAGLIQCAHVCWWSRLFHVLPWQLCQGKRRPTKGSTRLQPTLNLPPSVDGGGSDGGGGGGVAGVFLFS